MKPKLDLRQYAGVRKMNPRTHKKVRYPHRCWRCGERFKYTKNLQDHNKHQRCIEWMK